MFVCCFFQAEDGIRDLVRSRGLGDVYKRQEQGQLARVDLTRRTPRFREDLFRDLFLTPARPTPCLLYTSDAADERSSVDLGGRRIIKKKNYAMTNTTTRQTKKNNINNSKTNRYEKNTTAAQSER